MWNKDKPRGEVDYKIVVEHWEVEEEEEEGWNQQVATENGGCVLNCPSSLNPHSAAWISGDSDSGSRGSRHRPAAAATKASENFHCIVINMKDWVPIAAQTLAVDITPANDQGF